MAEAQVVCFGQLLLIAGDLNADPAVIPCLAKGISAGKFVDLALACSLGEGRKPVGWRIVLVLVVTSLSVAPMRWLLLLLARSRIGDSLLIFLSLLVLA